MKRLALAAAVLTTVALAGCGNDDEPTITPAPEPTAPSSAQEALPSVTTAPSPTTKGFKDADAALDSVTADVRTAAPRLEGYFRGRQYPRDLADVEQALPKAGVTLVKGNRLGSYTYNADAVEFVLCVEHPSGAWATYDTAPMATGEKGTTGGCP